MENSNLIFHLNISKKSHTIWISAQVTSVDALDKILPNLALMKVMNKTLHPTNFSFIKLEIHRLNQEQHWEISLKLKWKETYLETTVNKVIKDIIKTHSSNSNSSNCSNNSTNHSKYKLIGFRNLFMRNRIISFINNLIMKVSSIVIRKVHWFHHNMQQMSTCMLAQVG